MLNTTSLTMMLADAIGSSNLGALMPSTGRVTGGPYRPRGQAPARGILGMSHDPAMLGGKSPSRRDLHRFNVAKATAGPDHSAQIAREAKQARGRKARAITF